MEKTDIKYRSYIQILKEELVPAMGCTEPIALAYAAAKARETLGCLPDASIHRRKRQYNKECKERHRTEY